MSDEPGMVKIQAQTILSVTPQRTAESRLAAPTPEMAPVMTWVVLTGTPGVGGDEDADGAGRLGAEAVDRAELGDLLAHGLDDAPAAGERAQGDRGVGGEDDPEGDVERLGPAGARRSGWR